MKSFILGLGLMFLSSVAFAAPFVITDEHNAALVENYVVTLDGGEEVMVAPTVTAADKVVGVYDVGGLSDGAHTVTIKATNFWGSSAPIPFEFTVSLPPTIYNIQLVREVPGVTP